MREYRGLFRRLAGVLVIVFAIDLASISALGTTSRATFEQVGQPVQNRSTSEQPSSELLPSWAILVVGVGIGLGLISWGSSASRKLAQERRDAQTANAEG